MNALPLEIDIDNDFINHVLNYNSDSEYDDDLESDEDIENKKYIIKGGPYHLQIILIILIYYIYFPSFQF